MIRAQRALSFVVATLIAILCSAVLVTSGRAYAARDAVNTSIDDAGFRSITVEASTDSGLTVQHLYPLNSASSVESIMAFGDSTPVSNPAVPNSVRVDLRTMYLFGETAADSTTDVVSGARVSKVALDTLNLDVPAGELQSSSGTSYPVIGLFDTPAAFAALEPLVVHAVPTAGSETVRQAIIVVDEPAHVEDVVSLTSSLLQGLQSNDVVIQASTEFANLQAIVDTRLSGEAQLTTLAVFAIASGIVALTLFTFALMKRRDFGRRRALGASRRLLIALQIGQVTLLATLGALIGTFGTVLSMRLLDLPVPNWSFLAALAWCAICVAALASVIPAVFASRFDPATELRIP